MTLLHIVKFGNATLREKARPVTERDAALDRLIDDMIETMYEAPGIGLAAPQVGVPLRLFVCDPDYREDRASRNARVFINPEVVEEGLDDEALEEGCLSVPGITADVWRSTRLTVRAQDRTLKPFEVKAEGLFARVILHEMDHLDGVLFFDKLPLPKRTMLMLKLNGVQQREKSETAQLAGRPGPPWEALPDEFADRDGEPD